MLNLNLIFSNIGEMCKYRITAILQNMISTISPSSKNYLHQHGNCVFWNLYLKWPYAAGWHKHSLKGSHHWPTQFQGDDNGCTFSPVEVTYEDNQETIEKGGLFHLHRQIVKQLEQPLSQYSSTKCPIVQCAQYPNLQISPCIRYRATRAIILMQIHVYTLQQ